jgi:hypothetical protein
LLALYFLLTEEEFENLRFCLHDSVHLVAQRQKAFDEQVEKAAERVDDEERVFYYDHYSEEHERLHGKFPQLVSASTLLLACSLFESTLTDLCKYLDSLPTQLGLPSPKKTGMKARLTLITHWEDVKCSGILRPAAFLRKNFCIEAGRYSEWNTILGHYEVRHCLAHANGDVGLMRVNNGKQLKELLQKQPFSVIKINDSGRLQFGSGYVESVIDHMRGFLGALHAACFTNKILGSHFWS